MTQDSFIMDLYFLDQLDIVSNEQTIPVSVTGSMNLRTIPKTFELPESEKIAGYSLGKNHCPQLSPLCKLEN